MWTDFFEHFHNVKGVVGYESAAAPDVHAVLLMNRSISDKGELGILGREIWGQFNVFNCIRFLPLLTSIWEDVSQQYLPAAYRALKGTML